MALWAFVLAALPQAWAAPEISIDSVRSEVAQAEGVLDNEMIGKVDPMLRNPHRARWALERHVEPIGLGGYPLGGGRFGLRISGLRVSTRMWFRPSGPWYRAPEEFPCGGDARDSEWFATLEGSRIAAERAADGWESVLSGRRAELSTWLGKVILPPGTSAEAANNAAQLVFSNWLREGERDWREVSLDRARDAEWKHYREQVARSEVCAARGKKGKARSEPPQWEALMEPPGNTVPAAPIVRAPARRWDGLYSVRVGITIARKKVVGQFLIDSGAERSTISPDFLKAMGMPIELARVPGAQPLRLNPSSQITASGAGGSGLARLAVIESAEMSGHELPVHEFLLAGSDLFGPPESSASCCDGVLGLDFLRRYVVEFSDTLPFEVKLYSPWGYNAGEKRFWVETASKGAQGIVSNSCLAAKVGGKKSGGSSSVIDPRRSETPVRWDTGLQAAAASRSHVGAGLWTVECLERDVAHDFDVDPEESRSSPWKSGFTLGMPLISRIQPIFDLANGRIWLQRRSVPVTLLRNRSGLDVAFDFRDGDRILKVRSIKPGSPAQSLLKQGMKPGLVIEKLDDLSPSDLSEWEIEQRLAGAFGDTVTFKWTVKFEARTATMKLR